MGKVNRLAGIFVMLQSTLLHSFLYAFRRAFQLANRAPGCVFGMNKDIDIERITQSKYFRALSQQAKRDASNEMV